MNETGYKRNSYTITDFYLSYRDYIQQGTMYDIPYKTFRQIVTDYFEYIRDELMLRSKEFKIPCRLGTLQIVKHKPKQYNKASLRYDWKAMKELGKPVFLLNEHSNGFKYRFFWSKKNCLTPNKTRYMFIACRANKRNLCKLIRDEGMDYVEL